MFALSSDAAIANDTMLIKLNSHAYLAEATMVASALPCQRFDTKRRSGSVLALAGRCAR